jgi:hypothetical protein
MVREIQIIGQTIEILQGHQFAIASQIQALQITGDLTEEVQIIILAMPRLASLIIEGLRMKDRNDRLHSKWKGGKSHDQFRSNNRGNNNSLARLNEEIMETGKLRNV